LSDGGVHAALRAAVESGSLKDDPEQARAARRLDAVADGLARAGGGLFRRRSPPRGLWLHGPVGTGKSMLMSLFFEQAPIARKRRLHFHDFMAEVHDGLEARRKRGERDPIRDTAAAMAKSARLFCLDEAEITDIADAMIVGRFFDVLFARGVTVVATSNRAPAELYEGGINRELFTPFIDLICESMEVVQLDAGRDYRRLALAGEDLWVTPLGEDGEARLDALWARATGCAAEAAETVAVKGRAIEVPRAAAGCARFGFEALCGRPLGANDYLALARRYRALFIDGIPLLDAERRDVARRFVTLIDALYENDSVLAATAAAEPEHLYPEGDYAYEFRRAASRIAELRRADILAAAGEARKDAS